MRPVALLVVAALVAQAWPAAATPRAGAIARVVHPTAPPSLGPADALVRIELYFVPGIASSAVAYREVRALAARHPARLRVEFWPRRVGSTQREPAVALVAHRRGRFFAYLDRLTEAGPVQRSADLEPQLGIDPRLATAALADPDVQAALDDAERRAFRAGAASVLELVINGRPVSRGPVRMNANSFHPDQLEAAYQLAWRRARRAAVAGLTGRALAAFNRQRVYCDDDDGPDPEADADPVGDAIDDQLGLGALFDGGTDCPTPQVRPARIDTTPVGLDDELLDEAALSAAPLLGRPLPPPAAPMTGARTPAVDVVVVCGLGGPGCRAQLAIVHQLLAVYGAQVRLRWLPWLEPGAPGADAEAELAAVALCAAEHGDGWPFSDPPGLRTPPLDAAGLVRASGADPELVAGCVAGAGARVRALVAAARAAGIQWGPTVVVAGRAYPGGFTDRRSAAIVVEHALAPGLLEQLVR
ncbi:MAG: hypothetical protein R3B06_28855 [Kofleriaceae bacterium]